MDITKRLRLDIDEATEHAARVRISVLPPAGAAGGVLDISGSIYGPRCPYARTLPASHHLQTQAAGPAGFAAAAGVIPEPCYWTAELPFLYEAVLTIRLASGDALAWSHTFGLRRLHAAGRNLLVERRRVVLRGAVVDRLDGETVQQAHDLSASLLVQQPSDAVLQRADECGAGLVVGVAASLDLVAIARFTWRPSALVLLGHKSASVDLPRGGPLVGRYLPASAAADAAAGRGPLGIELLPGERPERSLASFPRPTIAVRLGDAYASLESARASADDLQAELAPEFDLAGYFVGPV